MITYPIPDISEAEYPAVYKICQGRIKATHAEWSWQQRTNQTNDVASGHELVPVSITPDELIAFCTRKDAKQIRQRSDYSSTKNFKRSDETDCHEIEQLNPVRHWAMHLCWRLASNWGL
jgi:hypothetical protein